jgi:type IV pilus assembly protein PilA
LKTAAKEVVRRREGYLPLNRSNRIKNLIKRSEGVVKIKKNQKGFSLVELIIVIAILGLLALLIVPKVLENLDEAKRTKEIANARALASEINIYNAKVKVQGGTELTPSDTTSISGQTIFKYEDVEDILQTPDSFPDNKIVVIKVDGEGNAYIDIL